MHKLLKRKTVLFSPQCHLTENLYLHQENVYVVPLVRSRISGNYYLFDDGSNSAELSLQCTQPSTPNFGSCFPTSIYTFYLEVYNSH